MIAGQFAVCDDFVLLIFVCVSYICALRMCTLCADKGAEIQATLYEMTGQKTVPNVFISGQHVG